MEKGLQFLFNAHILLLQHFLPIHHLQLPEPILPFHLYNSLMGLAKESLQVGGDPAEKEEAESSSGYPAVGRGSELVDLGTDSEPEALILVDKLREHLKELPKAHIATLRYIVRHLRRSVITPVLSSNNGEIKYRLTH